MIFYATLILHCKTKRLWSNETLDIFFSDVPTKMKKKFLKSGTTAYHQKFFSFFLDRVTIATGVNFHKKRMYITWTFKGMEKLNSFFFWIITKNN